MSHPEHIYGVVRHSVKLQISTPGYVAERACRELSVMKNTPYHEALCFEWFSTVFLLYPAPVQGFGLTLFLSMNRVLG
jgi:hypothetical protein